MIALDTWVDKAVGAVTGWVLWVTMRTYHIEKVMLTREEHEKICEKRHAETVDRFSSIEEKQDEMMKLLIDVIRK